MLIEGEDQIKFVFFCHGLVNNLREKHSKDLHCSNCGVFRTTKGPCINKVQCNKRKKYIDKVLGYTPIRSEEFVVENKDIFILLKHEEKIELLLEERGKELPNSKPRSFKEILGINARFMEVLHNLRQQV